MGYVEVEQGLGAFVSRRLRETLPPERPPFSGEAAKGRLPPALRNRFSRRLRALAPVPYAPPRTPPGRIFFRPWAGDHRLFPTTVWRRL